MKRLCVLQVTPTAPTPAHVEFFDKQEDCDFYFVTHDAPHPDALKYCPNTTWVDTRNILADLVPKEYEYYAFVDYDFKFYPQGDLGVREQIIADLEEFEPAVLTYYPGPGFHTPFNSDREYFEKYDYSVIPFTHCGMKVVHHTLMDWFFPMLTRFGGGVEACHVFNIQEIPFLRHVVCSHKMIYDNEVTDMETPHNVDGQWSMHRMATTWEWIQHGFKKNQIVKNFVTNKSAQLNEYFFWNDDNATYVPSTGDSRFVLDPLDVKGAFINLFKSERISPVPQVSEKGVDYYDKDKIHNFFEPRHELLINKDRPLSDQLRSLTDRDVDQVEEVLRKEVSYQTLRVTENPWFGIKDKVNEALPHLRDLTVTECVEIFQKMKDNTAIFYKNSKPDDRLEEYLQGKRVALVGPAPYLMGQNKGKLIDSYDVVVRIQPEIFSTPDYGSRTDVIQSCMNSSYSPKIVKYLETVPKEKYPDFIISNNTIAREVYIGSSRQDNQVPGNRWTNVVQEYDTYLKHYGVPFAHLWREDGTCDRYALYWEIYTKKYIERIKEPSLHYTPYSANLNSGYGAYSMLLRSDIKELAVFGMDFYNFGMYSTIEEKYNPEYIKQQGQEGSYLGPDTMVHDIVAQAMHMKNVLFQDPRFNYDNEPKQTLLSDEMSTRIEAFNKLPRLAIHNTE